MTLKSRGQIKMPLRESRTATIVRLTGVQKEVVFEVGLLGEAPGTDVTFERPRATVHVHVRLEIAGSGKGFGAQSTFVRFLLRERRERTKAW